MWVKRRARASRQVTLLVAGMLSRPAESRKPVFLHGRARVEPIFPMTRPGHRATPGYEAIDPVRCEPSTITHPSDKSRQ